LAQCWHNVGTMSACWCSGHWQKFQEFFDKRARRPRKNFEDVRKVPAQSKARVRMSTLQQQAKSTLAWQGPHSTSANVLSKCTRSGPKHKQGASPPSQHKLVGATRESIKASHTGELTETKEYVRLGENTGTESCSKVDPLVVALVPTRRMRHDRPRDFALNKPTF
jgi:hypothetical protein